MPAPLTEARMREIARVVATSPTMDGAALALGYKNANTLANVVAKNAALRQAVRESRVAAGRPTWGVHRQPLARGL